MFKELGREPMSQVMSLPCLYVACLKMQVSVSVNDSYLFTGPLTPKGFFPLQIAESFQKKSVKPYIHFM